MSDSPANSPELIDQLRAFTHPRVVTMLFLGFSAGLPILLIFSSLSLWLREADVSRASTTVFSWAALGYSFKFVWAPLVDRLPLPVLTAWLGRRRAWLLFAQIFVIAAIIWMALIDPVEGQSALTAMAFAAVLLGFSSATQDIVIDAYRIESADSDMQSLLSATYIAGYRIGMLVAGAGALVLAATLGSTAESYNYDAWRITYLTMAGCMLIGVLTTLIAREPTPQNTARAYIAPAALLRFILFFVLGVICFIVSYILSTDIVNHLKVQLTELSGNKALAGFVIESLRLVLAGTIVYIVSLFLTSIRLIDPLIAEQTYVQPVRDFFDRYGLSLAVLLLALIGLYRISDIVLGVISNVFYQDLGFSKTEIASVVKTFGLFMTILGGFVGGLMAMRIGIMRVLLLGAILAAATNLLFVWLAQTGNNLPLLVTVISADNLSAGLASAAFVAFLSALTNIRFTAVQYAIFSSLMTLLPKILGGYSGSIVDAVGYPQFFTFTALLGLPVIALILLAGKKLSLSEPKLKLAR